MGRPGPEANADAAARKSAATKQAHTPVPWMMTTKHLLGFGVLTDAMSLSADGPLVTCWAGGEIGYERAEANARLIAAAPELLEALQGLIRVVDAMKMTTGLGKTQIARLDGAKAAIAKATGQ